MKKYTSLLVLAFAFLLPLVLPAQTILNGTVSSKASGQAIEGVSVRVNATGTVVFSDVAGKFSIPAAKGAILDFSFVGFTPLQLKADSLADNFLVSLQPSGKSLDAVVVTALGVSRQRKSLGYATQELKAKDLAAAKEANLVNALAGKIAGVRVTNSQGDMGSSRIIIRGETSIAGNNQPLFIVDGIPVDNSQLGSGSRNYRNAIADLNSEDIETISVLKGPNAAALYGSRAAHGVILIKTKTGRTKTGIGVTVNSNTSFSNLLELPKYQNIFGQGADGKFSYVDGKGAGINDGVDESWGPRLDGQLIPQFYSHGEAVPFVAYPDNVKDFFRTGVTLSNSIALEGAGDKYNYRIAYNREKQNGVVPNSEAAKNNFSFNTQYTVTSRLKLGINANYIANDAPNLPGAGGRRATSTMLQFTWFGRQVDIRRLRDYKDANGSTFNWNNSYYSNPYWVAYENTVSQRRNRFIGSVQLDYKIIDGLNLNLRTGTDYYNDKRKQKIAFGTNGTPYGSYEEDAYTVNENNSEATLRYDKKLNEDFHIDVLAGGNVRSKFFEENIQQAPRLAVANVYTLTNSRDPLISSNYYSTLRTYSAYGSAQVGYRNYAFLSLTARNDWSSTLPAQNKSYFYPSVNASFVVTEAFNLRSAVLSFARVRGGWSKVGSDADPYQLINTYNFNAPFNGNPQLVSSGIDFNPDLKSESTNSTELGLELGLLNNRVRFDLSLYTTNSIDQILKVDVSPTTGYTQKLLNAGKINNRGLEIQLGATPVRTTNFNWDIDLNYGANRSKLIVLDKEGNLENYVLGSYRNVQVVASVDKPYGTLFGNAYLRDAKGNIVVNSKGIPVANPSKKVLGKYPPDWIGGIQNSFSYKGFQLSFLVDASIGGSIFAGTNSTGSYTGVLELTLKGRDAAHGGLQYYYPGNNKTINAVGLSGGGSAPNGEKVYEDGIIFDGVTADGKKNATIISATQYYKAPRNIEEQFVYSADYVKLREVKLTYTLPGAWIRKIGLVDANVSLIGRNLWIIHKNVPNIDPETAFSTGNAQGLEDLTLPTVRSFGFNINFKF